MHVTSLRRGMGVKDGENGRAKAFAPGLGALVTLVVVAMFNVMGGVALSPALPAMGEAFPQASETAISLVITLPPLAVAISGLFMGALATACNLGQFSCTLLAGSVLALVGAHSAVFAVGAVISLAGSLAAVIACRCMGA